MMPTNPKLIEIITKMSPGHSMAVWGKVTPVSGAAKCTICETMQADCLRFKAGWFSECTICDGCIAVMLRMCDKNKGGEVKDGDE